MRIPRIIKKEIFRYVFSSDGEHPISYPTLFKNYILPHLDEIGITREEYKSYRKGIPYGVSKKIIEVHQIEDEEILHALELLAAKKQVVLS
jgi:hypothetical protein